nr:spore coat U domain-containing protein [Burkholderia cepacia]
MFCRRVVIVAILALFGALHVQAQCVVASSSPAAFGSVTSINVESQQQSTSSSNSGLTCRGALAAFLVVGNYINGTIVSANGGKLVGPTGDTISYSLFADQNYTNSLNFGTTYNWASTQLLSLLGIGGGSSVPLSLYFRTALGGNVSAGIYTDTLTITWNWHVCSGVGLVLCLGWSDGSGTSTVPVTLTVTNDCTIIAPDVSFGAAPTVANFAPVNGSLSLTCTKGLTYTVGLSPGSNVASNGRRQMTRGSNVLHYDVYSSGGNAVWGHSTNRVSSSGAADGMSVQQFPYVAKIYRDQSTPPVGTYTDSVIVDVRY